jgi:DNA-binding response OmpR family regulator
MSKRIFLIHWHADEAHALAEGLRASGWSVEVEAEDGARAGQRILAETPEVVLIYLRRLPSHGRETGRWLHSSSRGAAIPIVFVDGEERKVARVRAALPEAIFTSAEELPSVLKRFAPGGSAGE